MLRPVWTCPDSCGLKGSSCQQAVSFRPTGRRDGKQIQQARPPNGSLEFGGFLTTCPEEMLHLLFAQNLPIDIRLLWSILITTGMRLDEASLLTTSSIKTEKGVRYFDLTEAIVKNKGSAREVPVPSVITGLMDVYCQRLKVRGCLTFP